MQNNTYIIHTYYYSWIICEIYVCYVWYIHIYYYSWIICEIYVY